MRRALRLDGVADIECAGWDRYVTGATYRPIDGHKIHRTLPRLVDEMLKIGGDWWAWSGGTYDTLAVADELQRRGLPARLHLSGARVTRLECGDLALLDAYALIPLDLDTACEIAGEAPVGPLGWRCHCGEACGGYCAITTRLSESRRRELDGYCAEDARKGYRVLAAFWTYAAAHGIEIRSTLGGTAWATAQAWLDLPAADWHHATWRRVRAGYYGGRLTVGRARAAGGWRWDLASAYPAALAHTPVPVGPHEEVGAGRARRALAAGLPGVYQATVTVPERWLPPLPIRLPSGRVGYPHGVMAGTWTGIELAAATARGAHVDDVTAGVIWQREAIVYRRFVQEGYRLRQEAGRGTAIGQWWRLCLNALSGKLAEQPERGIVALYPGLDRVVICDGVSPESLIAGCSLERCTGRCGAWEQLDQLGLWWRIPVYRMGQCSHVHHAATLTAATRARWLDGAERVDGFAYGDTDSLFAEGGSPGEESDQLGGWVPLGSWGDLRVEAPKAYSYVDGNTGETVARVAGLSRRGARRWLTEREREIVDARGVHTFMEAVRGGGPLLRRRERTYRRPDESTWRGDRVVSASGITYPVDHGSLIERDLRRSGRGRQADRAAARRTRTGEGDEGEAPHRP